MIYALLFVGGVILGNLITFLFILWVLNGIEPKF